ncbi:MAG: deoxyhypusine synthase family protein [Pirellulaceae bacterium]|nr:deoxyhypusine synthase family protein [Pirellulaceae bacterium]
MKVSDFLEEYYRHFNARETLDAARGWRRHVEQGGKMMLTLAGAMSTSEIGVLLAPLIRAGWVHAISTTAANFEEDLYNLLAHNDYRLTTNYRELSTAEEVDLRDSGYNRVTDTCIPEWAFRDVEKVLVEYWREAAEKGESYFPHEYCFRLLAEGRLRDRYHIPPEHSWVIAAQEMNIPIYTPGFEDSTMGNIFAARVIEGKVPTHNVIRHGTEQMQHLVEWYRRTAADASIGFFQIGGGIAGDFAICAVPLMVQDLEWDVPLWGYFAQISDSTTSYGSYSGAVPNEKITWYKLNPEAPKFMINSDASIVAPLIFAYLLDL